MQSFSVDISRFVGKNKERANKLVKKIGMALYQDVTTRTPVDTGRARANWRCEIGEVDVTTDENTVLDGMRAAVKFAGAKMGNDLNISNSLPYVEGLEHGNSRQAPNGMVAVTVKDIKDKIERGEFEA